MFRRVGSVSAHALLLAAVVSVCSAQSTLTDSTNAAATLVTLIGQVSILRDSQPWALNAGDLVKPRQVILTGPDGYALFKLSDGSTFEMFPNSRVIFRNTPGDWQDLLEMMLGRVKVHIQRWGGQPNPNKVRTPTAIISVRGTTFDVAVEEQDSTLVMVDEGQVVVQHALKGGEPKVLNTGEWMRVYKDQPLAQKSIDKGSVIQAMLRTAADAIYTTIYRTPRTSGPTAGGGPAGGGPVGGGGPLPTDRKNPTPPPPPGGDTGAPPPPPPPGS